MHRYQVPPVGGATPSPFLLFDAAPDDPSAGVELRLSEEARGPLAHRQEQPAVHCGVELEAEEPGVALPEELENADVVLHDLSGRRELGVEGDHRVEQTIDGHALGL